MALTAQELIEVMTKAKELGLTSFKAEGIEFSSSQQDPKPTVEQPQEVTVDDYPIAPPSPWDDLTEEEILYWSCPHGGELEAKRKEQQERTKEQQTFEDSKV